MRRDKSASLQAIHYINVLKTVLPCRDAIYRVLLQMTEKSQIVTYLFTFSTTKKDNLLRELVDAENERSMWVVFTFARKLLTLKPMGPMG